MARLPAEFSGKLSAASSIAFASAVPPRAPLSAFSSERLVRKAP